MKRRFMLSLCALGLIAQGASANAACYDWPLRQNAFGYLAYDGDTINIKMPGLPPEIADMRVRVRGIDTPEMHSQCQSEHSKALKAARAVNSLLLQAIRAGEPVLFCDPEWGRYAGRVVASVQIGGKSLDQYMIRNGLARPYDGHSKRAGWCK